MPRLKMFPAQNVMIVEWCCASIVMVNKTSRCMLDVFKMISCSNVVRVPSFISILKLWAV